MSCRQTSSPVETSAAPAAAPRLLTGYSAQRVQRLEALVELKKLYRNCIRAEALLALPSPVYEEPEGEQQSHLKPAEARRVSLLPPPMT